jgi:hypothetical protein
MSDGFNKGWLIAVKWIIDESVGDYGINPKGDKVSSKMSSLPQIRGVDAGFAEGLIYAIGKPLSELKNAIK